MKRQMPVLIPCGTSPSHTDRECDYYFMALTRHPWTRHDILMRRRELRMAIEDNERRFHERDIYKVAHGIIK